MTENETTSQTSTRSGSGAKTAVKAAAAAAATGAAAVAVRKALSSNEKSHASRNGDDGHASSGGSFLTSIASGGWDAARDALVPLAEDAAGAAGTYLAKNGPEFVRETVVPRFIKAFNDAQEG